MDKQSIRTSESGSPSLLLIHIPEGLSRDGTELTSFAVPVQFRNGGLLLCLPRGALSEEALIQALSGDDPHALLGPSKLLDVKLCEEGESGEVVQLTESSHMYVVDFSDDVLAFLSEYDGVLEDAAMPCPFSNSQPAALPDTSHLNSLVDAWISQQGADRVNFYSAREEQESPDVPKVAAKSAAAKRPSAAPKRVTQAQLLEQLSLLSDQVNRSNTRQPPVLQVLP